MSYVIIFKKKQWTQSLFIQGIAWHNGEIIVNFESKSNWQYHLSPAARNWQNTFNCLFNRQYTCISELRNEIKTKRNESYLTKNSNITKPGTAHKDTNNITDSCQFLDLEYSNSIVRFNTLAYDKRGDFSLS